MPRPRKHHNAPASNPAVTPGPAADALPAEPIGSTWAYATGTAREHSCLEAIQTLARRNDGWIRIVPLEDGALVYAMFKFTSRRWPNQ